MNAEIAEGKGNALVMPQNTTSQIHVGHLCPWVCVIRRKIAYHSFCNISSKLSFAINYLLPHGSYQQRVMGAPCLLGPCWHVPGGAAAEIWLCWPQQKGLAKPPPLSLSHLPCHSSEHKFEVSTLYICCTCLVPGLSSFSCLGTLGLGFVRWGLPMPLLHAPLHTPLHLSSMHMAFMGHGYVPCLTVVLTRYFSSCIDAQGSTNAKCHIDAQIVTSISFSQHHLCHRRQAKNLCETKEKKKY